MKVLFAVSIIIFWLAFPFGVILMNSQLQVAVLDTTYYDEINEPTSFNVLTFFDSIWDFVKIYFRAMYMFIPGATGFWSLFILMLQVVSGLIIYLLLRGD